MDPGDGEGGVVGERERQWASAFSHLSQSKNGWANPRKHKNSQEIQLLQQFVSQLLTKKATFLLVHLKKLKITDGLML